MLIPITINGKDYNVVGNVEIDNKNYIAYEDEDNIYINAYTFEDDKLNLLEITDEEKDKVIKELDL